MRSKCIKLFGTAVENSFVSTPISLGEKNDRRRCATRGYEEVVRVQIYISG